MGGMSRVALSSQIDALEASVRGARQALACSFSSSDEYEAAIIQERRDAGLYGTTGYSPFAWGCALIVVLVLFFIVI